MSYLDKVQVILLLLNAFACIQLGDRGRTKEYPVSYTHLDVYKRQVDGNGVMSNTFPASLSALTSSGQANIGGDFRFARVWNSKTSGSGYADNLTILWSETVSDETTKGLMTAAHSQLKAVRLLAEDTDDDDIVDDFWLTAPQVVAELPGNTLLDHFDAYVETSYADNSQPVSYTHLDVYKRQRPGRPENYQLWIDIIRWIPLAICPLQ